MSTTHEGGIAIEFLVDQGRLFTMYRGRIRFELLEDDAPKTTENFRLLAEKDEYTEGHTRRVALLAVGVLLIVLVLGILVYRSPELILSVVDASQAAEFDEALDKFCEEWNLGTPDKARFEQEYLLAAGTRA